jgi:hypothetical protein
MGLAAAGSILQAQLHPPGWLALAIFASGGVGAMLGLGCIVARWRGGDGALRRLALAAVVTGLATIVLAAVFFHVH